MTIAQFALSRDLPAHEPKPAYLAQLSNLLLRREQLLDILRAERNHLEHAADNLTEEITDLMSILKARVKTLEKQIRELTGQIPELAAQDKIIQSIPGVGLITSATLIVYLPELLTYGRKQITALVGLAPYNRDSGKYRGQRHIREGARACEKRFIVPCARACSLPPRIRGWFEHFLAQGKPYKVAAIACCRKLLVVIRAMLMNASEWREGYVHP